MHLLIISPIFSPSTGGAATYYHLLAVGLLGRGVVKRVTVITERLPGRPSHEHLCVSGIEVIRLFPFRASGALGLLSQYFRYGFQNLLYFRLPFLISALKPDIVLVHSSFHNIFNVFRQSIRFVAKAFPIIGDIRDHQLPLCRLGHLGDYHGLIVCSINVRAHVQRDPFLRSKIQHIPVVQEALLRSGQQVNRTLGKFNLEFGSYLLFAGLIKTGKGVELLLETYRILRSRGLNTQLILIGVAKDKKLLDRALSIPGVIYLGALPRAEVLDLMSCARLVVNISFSEGMPRTCLEALALGVRTMLPRGVPEFERYCLKSVARSKNPDDLALQVEELLASPPEKNYPLGDHSLEAVLPQYENLFHRILVDFQYEAER